MTEQVPTNCAVCQLSDGLVVNIIVALPSDPTQDGCQLIEVMADQFCDIGWYWDGVTFIPPVEVPVVDEPPVEEPAPVIEEPVLVIEDPTPLVEEPTPVVDEPI